MEIYTGTIDSKIATQQLAYINDNSSAIDHFANFKDAKIFKLDTKKDLTYFTKAKNGRLSSFLLLNKLNGWAAIEEELVWCSIKYRGQGLASALYKTAIDLDNQQIISDDRQSPNAISMWRGFLKTRRWNIFAIDIKRPDQPYQLDCQTDSDEVFIASDEHLATDILWTTSKRGKLNHNSRDIRLVASKY